MLINWNIALSGKKYLIKFQLEGETARPLEPGHFVGLKGNALAQDSSQGEKKKIDLQDVKGVKDPMEKVN